MRAMVFEEAGQPLREREVSKPSPGPGELSLAVRACGICRTDLHVLDGDLDDPNAPVIPGHQIVGEVEALGPDVEEYDVGDRVGVPWLGSTCGRCEYCEAGRENLCASAEFTGYHHDGGFAEYAVADSHFCFPIPEGYPDLQAAPLLCAGLIGYRSWRMAARPATVGFYGFGSAAHILAQVAQHEGSDVYAFTKPGDEEGQAFARDLGAVWAGGSDEQPPTELDAAIIFAPVGPLVPEALEAVRRGGRVVCAGIHMSDIPSFSYDILWGEREVRSVANLTRRDGVEFLQLAPEVPVETTVTTFSLGEANEALEALRRGDFDGSGVIVVDEAIRAD
ncbi:MAG: zinc-dependent alcohol dehydrogenase family protein [Bradymonadaceae bacterium]